MSICLSSYVSIYLSTTRPCAVGGIILLLWYISYDSLAQVAEGGTSYAPQNVLSALTPPWPSQAMMDKVRPSE